MRRHPYATGGMYDPLMKWWQDMASYWMSYGTPYGSGSWSPGCDERDAGREHDSRGPRSHGPQPCQPRTSPSPSHPHHQGHSTPDQTREAWPSVRVKFDSGPTTIETYFKVHKPPCKPGTLRLVRAGDNYVVPCVVEIQAGEIHVTGTEKLNPGFYEGTCTDAATLDALVTVHVSVRSNGYPPPDYDSRSDT